jgi:hypothetical protein
MTDEEEVEVEVESPLIGLDFSGDNATAQDHADDGEAEAAGTGAEDD